MESGCFPAVDAPSQLNSEFGYPVAMNADGSIIVVGAFLFDAVVDGVPIVDSGAAFVFERKTTFSFCTKGTDEGKFHLVQVLTAKEPQTNARFGGAVAISADGNRIAVGAQNNLSDTNLGAVFVFDRRRHGEQQNACGPSKWFLVQTLFAQRNESETQCNVVPDETSVGFGVTLSLSKQGNVLAVTNAEGGENIEIFVYIYEDCMAHFSSASSCGEKPCNPFQFRQRISRQNVADAFGLDVATIGSIGLAVATNGDGSLIAFSGYNDTVNSVSAAGRAYIYKRCHRNRGWQSLQYFEPSTANISIQGWFGLSLALTPCGKYFAIEALLNTDDFTPYVAVFVQNNEDCYVRATEDLTADGNFNGFNNSLAISNDGCVIAVGYEESTVSTAMLAGDVVVYDKVKEKDENGKCTFVWKERQKLSEIPLRDGAGFGSGLAMDAQGLTLAAGATGFEAEFTPEVVNVFVSNFARPCAK